MTVMSSSSSPIIQSILDTDAYKLHMQQAVFHSYRDATVTAEFRCRNEDDILGQFADEVIEQIHHMEGLRLTDEEYTYLASLPFFKEDYLHYLCDEFRFKSEQVEVSTYPTSYKKGNAITAGTQLKVTVRGPWVEAIMWEVPLLAVISEIVHRFRTPQVGPALAVEKLREKVDKFFVDYANTPEKEAQLRAQFRVSDFGTRRRYSRGVQHAIIQELKNGRFSPFLVGTSNYDLARRFGITPVGTQAHEWFQAFQAIVPDLAISQRAALDAWLHEYPNQLGIALTDCITMEAFLNDFDSRFASTYIGIRQDSGDPFEWGRKAIEHYRKLGIDSKEKVLVFSDSLDFDKAMELFNTFHDEAKVMFGIGTQLTCSIKPFVRPLNIVMKLVECNDKPVAKLSDSPGKLMCADQEFVERLCKAFKVSALVYHTSAAKSHINPVSASSFP